LFQLLFRGLIIAVPYAIYLVGCLLLKKRIQGITPIFVLLSLSGVVSGIFLYMVGYDTFDILIDPLGTIVIWSLIAISRSFWEPIVFICPAALIWYLLGMTIFIIIRSTKKIRPVFPWKIILIKLGVLIVTTAAACSIGYAVEKHRNDNPPPQIEISASGNNPDTTKWPVIDTWEATAFSLSDNVSYYGETVTVDVSIKNTGAAKGIAQVELKAGNYSFTKNVLIGDETVQIRFKVKISDDGIITIICRQFSGTVLLMMKH
jgi:hypothetical protein